MKKKTRYKIGDLVWDNLFNDYGITGFQEIFSRPSKTKMELAKIQSKIYWSRAHFLSKSIGC